MNMAPGTGNMKEIKNKQDLKCMKPEACLCRSLPYIKYIKLLAEDLVLTRVQTNVLSYQKYS